jgi:hypothetical protein
MHVGIRLFLPVLAIRDCAGGLLHQVRSVMLHTGCFEAGGLTHHSLFGLALGPVSDYECLGHVLPVVSFLYCCPPRALRALESWPSPEFKNRRVPMCRSDPRTCQRRGKGNLCFPLTGTYRECPKKPRRSRRTPSRRTVLCEFAKCLSDIAYRTLKISSSAEVEAPA